MNFAPPSLLTADHQTEDFDCGHEALNQYLKRFALMNAAAGASRTYVTTASGGGRVAGFYSLAAASVEKVSAPERVAKGVANHPIPVALLARLAVDRKFQGQGVGCGLLRDALLRCLAAAGIVGIRAVLVHAKNDEAAAFYRKFGFVPSPTDPLHLMLLMKDLRQTLQS